MQAWLTLPVRLVVVAFIGCCVWLVMDSAAGRLSSALSQSQAAPESAHQAGRTMEMPSPGHAAPIFAGIAVATFGLVALEFVRFRRFISAVRSVARLGGTIRFEPQFDWPLLCFYLSKSTLDLSGSPASDASIPAFQFVPRLVCVRLAETAAGTAAVRELSRCPELVSLDLSATKIVDTDVSLLRSSRKLRNLLLNRTAFSDEGARLLTRVPQLTKIEFFDTAVTSAGVSVLRAAFPEAVLTPTCG